MIEKKVKICPNCGDKHNNSRSKYCCKKIIKECPVCDTEFEIDCNGRTKTYCSRKCTSINANLSRIANKQYPPPEECKRCGKEFVVKSETKDGIVGCSPRCRFQLRTGQFQCKVCDELYWPTAKDSVVCSNSCSGILAQSNEAKEKRAITNLKRYGVENVFKSEKIKEKIKQTTLENYGVEYSFQAPEIQKKIKETNLKKYGVIHPLQNKKILKKVQKTNLKRYGNVCSVQNPEIQKKAQSTMLERYGVETSFKSKDILNKARQTSLERYGHENPFGSEEIKERIKQVNLERYGAENYSNRETLEQELKERDNYVIKLYEEGLSEYEIAELLEYEYITIRRVLLKNNIVESNNISVVNKYWVHIIQKKLNIEFKHEGKIFTNKRMSVDLYNEEFKIAIDINPTITHSTQRTPFPHRNTTPIKYHQERAIDANDNGWDLIQIFDWENEEDILELLKSKFGMNEKIYARKCDVKEITSVVSKEFLNENHRQKGKANSSIQYGLYYEKELIQVMTFSKERFSREKLKDSYELLRLTSKQGLTVVGGASKLLQAFIKSNYNPNSIKTFADFSKGSGKTYEKLGMTYEGFANFNALYSNIYTNEAYKVTEVTNKYKKEYNKLGLSQQEYMNSKDFYRINDAGHKIYRWNK